MTTKSLNRRRFSSRPGGSCRRRTVPPAPLPSERRRPTGPSLPLRSGSIVFFTHYGCLTNRWFPARSHGPLTQGRLHGDADARSHGALRGQAAHGARHPRHERVELRGDARAERTTPTRRSVAHVHVPPADPQRHGVIGKQRREVRRHADRPLARSRLRRAGQPERWPAALHPDWRRPAAAPPTHMSVISYDKPGQIFPAYGTPTQIFTNLTGPLRLRARCRRTRTPRPAGRASSTACART